MASERARSLVMEHWIEAWDRSRVVNASPLDSEEVAKHLQKSKKAERALLDYIESLEAERERREEAEDALSWCARQSWEGWLDPGDFQDEMIRRGLMVEVPASDEIRAEYDTETMYTMRWMEPARQALKGETRE